MTSPGSRSPVSAVLHGLARETFDDGRHCAAIRFGAGRGIAGHLGIKRSRLVRLSHGGGGQAPCPPPGPPSPSQVQSSESGSKRMSCPNRILQLRSVSIAPPAPMSSISRTNSSISRCTANLDVTQADLGYHTSPKRLNDGVALTRLDLRCNRHLTLLNSLNSTATSGLIS